MKYCKWYEHKPVKDLRELLRRSAKKYSKRVAFRFRGLNNSIISVTYSKLLDDVNSFGTALANLGMQGAHVAVIGENSYEWIVTYLAVVNGLGTIVPVDKDLTDEEIVNILEQSDASAVVCSKTFFPIIRKMLSKLPKLKLCIAMQTNEGYSQFTYFYELLEKGSLLLQSGVCSYIDADIEREAMCSLHFTSGTTGSSKAVMLSHKNICSVVNCANITDKTGRVALSVLPLHHTYEFSICILSGLDIGVTICLNQSIKYFQQDLKVFKPSMIVLVPLIVETLYKRIMDRVRDSGKQAVLERMIPISSTLLKFGIDIRTLVFHDIHKAFGGRLRIIFCGGATLRPELVARFREIGIKLINGYGITECAPLVSFNRSGQWNDSSVGVIIPCCEVKIHEPDDKGEGEILVRGDNVMLGYYKSKELTEQAFIGDWFCTGDIGRILEGGFLQITGRKKDTIILSNGKNIQPEEIEEYITTHIPYIKDVVVFAPNMSGIVEKISAIVVPTMEYVIKYGIKDLEIMLHEDIHKLNRHLPSFKQVSDVRLQIQDFEKTSLKKIKRFKISG